MELARQVVWSLIIGSINDPQAVFYVEKPSFYFENIKETRGGKTILVPNRHPVWRPITIELPTRLLGKTLVWLEEKTKRDISIIGTNAQGALLEAWILKEARPVTQHIQNGRNIMGKVLCVVIKYEWARREK